MRTETITYRIYTFNELPETSQTKALDRYRGILTDFNNWYESNIEYYKEFLQGYGFMRPTVYFDLHGQGCGACFDCEHVDLDTLLNKLKATEGYTATQIVAKKEALQNSILTIRIIPTDSATYYSHENTRTIDFELDYNIDEISLPRISKVLETFQEEVEQLRKSLCKEIYKSLDDEWDYLSSNVALKEHFIINNTEFTEDGKIYG